MKRLLTILLCLLLALGAVACGQEEEVDTSSPTTADTEQEDDTVYALDPLIDRFFAELTAAYPKTMDPYSIHRGVDIKEYLAVVSECDVTVRNVSYDVTPDDGSDPYTVEQLRIIIEGGTTEKEQDKMMNAFAQIAKTIDTGCSDTLIASAVAHMEEQTGTLSDYRFTNFFKVERYIPIVEEHGVPCRIDLLTINYLSPKQ